MDFGSHVDDVATASAALVNVVTPGFRQGREYTLPRQADLVAPIGDALRLASATTSDPATRKVSALVALGEAARPVYELIDDAAFDEAADVVNALLRRYRPTPTLSHHDGKPWHLHFHGPASGDPSGWGGGMSVALATVLGGEYADRLGVCAAPSCDRVFIDVSRNGTRRFCSEACQNRVKAAAHRARQRA